MKKIDRETVQHILDTADIVDVVSDFVSLKRRGANYIGLCPFHNERTPSFSVSKAKGICKCFSCGKGGSPVNFIMELEQLSYQEALRYLAKKYNIEIVEHEMSEQEKQEESQRESMLAINAFALQHFESNLADTPDGREIDLAYFRQRGINDAMIAKFHLGYAIENGNTLHAAAIAKGYNEKYLLETGLCIKSERGTVYDRFKGRVIYPVHSVSGKVVAFGGRTLRSDKSMAKYVNSPESIIYSKSRELYGLYQAKQSIAKKNKCILVEGYMDVISMHQSGVENVVASSGTSLTEGQIRLIHRFTDNVTVIYDSDPAGIKASLRGIDMILAEGINVKVLSLPDGDDPDSFAQSHSAQELEDYLANETDFIRFKTKILLNDAAGDPIARSRVITDILRTIAVIPDAVTRTVYIAECSRAFEIDEQVLMLQLSKLIAERNEAIERQSKQAEARNSIDGISVEPANSPATVQHPVAEASKPGLATLEGKEKFLEPFERELLRFVIKYGMVDLCEAEDENGETVNLKTVDYINYELQKEEISFSIPLYRRIFNQVVELSSGPWTADNQACIRRLAQERADDEQKIRDEIGAQSLSVSEIKAKEIAMSTRLEEDYAKRLTDYAEHYVEQRLCSSPEDDIRILATELVSERHKLSKIHSKFSKIETERDRLIELVPRAVYELLYGILLFDIKEIEHQLASASDQAVVRMLLQKYVDMKATQQEFAKYLGERIVAPRPKNKI